MEILLVATGLPDVNGHGGSAFNSVYIEELVKAGVEVTVLHLRSVSFKRFPSFKRKMAGADCYTMSVFFPPSPLFKKPPLLTWLFLYLLPVELEGFDVIHAVGGGSAEVAYLVGSRTNRPFILQFYGDDLNTLFGQHLATKNFRHALNHASYLCFNSESLRQVFFSKVKSDTPWKVLRRGVRLSEFRYEFARTAEINILFLGGIPSWNEKGAITLLDAIRHIDQKNLKTTIRFFIGGPRSLSVKDYIAVSNKKLSLEFIGEIDRAGVIQYMQESHIVLIPSEKEGLPNVLFEAMASGNMVIASNVGGIPEVLRNNVSGILIEPNDPVGLADAILTATEDADCIEQYARAGRSAIERFDYSNFIAGYLDIYRYCKQIRDRPMIGT